MLILDAKRVDQISLKRFASVVESELASSEGSQSKSDNNLTWQGLSTTLAHNLRSTAEDTENSVVLNKLRTQVDAVAGLKPTEKLQHEIREPEKPASAPTLPIDKLTISKASSVADAVSDSSAVDTASGERIQYLLQDQKDLTAKDLEVEQRTQAMLVNELTELTSMLKESTMDINRAVKIQNIQLASMGVHAAENRDELEKQKQRMKESTQGMTTSLWATVWLMVWIIGLFCGTYAVIRLLPSRTVYPTCSNKDVFSGTVGELNRYAEKHHVVHEYVKPTRPVADAVGAMSSDDTTVESSMVGDNNNWEDGAMSSHGDEKSDVIYNHNDGGVDIDTVDEMVAEISAEGEYVTAEHEYVDDHAEYAHSDIPAEPSVDVGVFDDDVAIKEHTQQADATNSEYVSVDSSISGNNAVHAYDFDIDSSDTGSDELSSEIEAHSDHSVDTAEHTIAADTDVDGEVDVVSVYDSADTTTYDEYVHTFADGSEPATMGTHTYTAQEVESPGDHEFERESFVSDDYAHEERFHQEREYLEHDELVEHVEHRSHGGEL